MLTSFDGMILLLLLLLLMSVLASWRVQMMLLLWLLQCLMAMMVLLVLCRVDVLSSLSGVLSSLSGLSPALWPFSCLLSWPYFLCTRFPIGHVVSSLVHMSMGYLDVFCKLVSYWSAGWRCSCMVLSLLIG